MSTEDSKKSSPNDNNGASEYRKFDDDDGVKKQQDSGHEVPSLPFEDDERRRQSAIRIVEMMAKPKKQRKVSLGPSTAAAAAASSSSSTGGGGGAISLDDSQLSGADAQQNEEHAHNELEFAKQGGFQDVKSCTGIYVLSSMWCSAFYVVLLFSALFLRQTVHIVLIIIAVAKPCVRRIRNRGLTNTMPQTHTVWLCAGWSLMLLLALVVVAIMSVANDDGLERARAAAYILDPIGVFNPVDHPVMCALGVLINVALLLLCIIYHKLLGDNAAVGECPDVAKRRRLHERIYLIRICCGLAVAAFTRPSLLTVVFYLLHIVALALSFCVTRTVVAKWRLLQGIFIFTSSYTGLYMLVFLATQNAVFASLFPPPPTKGAPTPEGAIPDMWGLKYRDFEAVLRDEFALGVFYAVHVLAMFDVMHTARRIHGRFGLLTVEEANNYVEDRNRERHNETRERARKGKGKSLATTFLNAFIDAFPILMLPGLVIVVNLIQNVPSFGVLLVTIFGFVAPMFVFVPALPALYCVCSFVIAYAFVSEVIGGAAADWMALYLFRDKDYNRAINMLSLSVLAACCTCWVFVFSLKKKLASTRAASKTMQALMTSKRNKLERALDVVEDRLHPLAVQFKSLCDPGSLCIAREGFPALIHVAVGVEPTAAEVDRLWSNLVLKSEEYQHQQRQREKFLRQQRAFAAAIEAQMASSQPNMAAAHAAAVAAGKTSANFSDANSSSSATSSFAKHLALFSADEDEDDEEEYAAFDSSIAAGGAPGGGSDDDGDGDENDETIKKSKATRQRNMFAHLLLTRQQVTAAVQQKELEKQAEKAAKAGISPPSVKDQQYKKSDEDSPGRKRAASAIAASSSSRHSPPSAAAATVSGSPRQEEAGEDTNQIGEQIANRLRFLGQRARSYTSTAVDAASSAAADAANAIASGGATTTPRARGASMRAASSAVSGTSSSSSPPTATEDSKGTKQSAASGKGRSSSSSGKDKNADGAHATHSLAAELLQDEENMLHEMTSRSRMASVFSNQSTNTSLPSMPRFGSVGPMSAASTMSLHREESRAAAAAGAGAGDEEGGGAGGGGNNDPFSTLPPPGLRFSGFLELHSEVSRYRMWDYNFFFVFVALLRDVVARNTESFSLLIMFAAASYRPDLDCIRMLYILFFVAFLCFPSVRRDYWWFLVMYNILVILVLYAFSLVYQVKAPSHIGIISSELLGLRRLEGAADLYINFVLLAVAMLQYRTRASTKKTQQEEKEQQQQRDQNQHQKENNLPLPQKTGDALAVEHQPQKSAAAVTAADGGVTFGGEDSLRNILSDMEWTRIGKAAATKSVKARVALLITVVCFMAVVAVEDQSALVAVFATIFVSKLRAQIKGPDSCLAGSLGFFASFYSVLALIAVALYQFPDVREWFEAIMGGFSLCTSSTVPSTITADMLPIKCATDLGFTAAERQNRSSTMTLLPWFVASTSNIVLFTLETDAAAEAAERRRAGPGVGGAEEQTTDEERVTATRDSAWLSRPVHFMFSCLAFLSKFNTGLRLWLSHHGSKVIWLSLFIAGVRKRSCLNSVYIFLLALDRRGWTCVVIAALHLCVVYVYPLFFVPSVPGLDTEWERFVGAPKKTQQGTLGAPVLVIVCSLIYLQAKKQAAVLRPSLAKQGMVFFANDRTSLGEEATATRDSESQELLEEAAASVARFELPPEGLPELSDSMSQLMIMNNTKYTSAPPSARNEFFSVPASASPGADDVGGLRRRRTASTFSPSLPSSQLDYVLSTPRVRSSSMVAAAKKQRIGGGSLLKAPPQLALSSSSSSAAAPGPRRINSTTAPQKGQMDDEGEGQEMTSLLPLNRGQDEFAPRSSGGNSAPAGTKKTSKEQHSSSLVADSSSNSPGAGTGTTSYTRFEDNDTEESKRKVQQLKRQEHAHDREEEEDADDEQQHLTGKDAEKAAIHRAFQRKKKELRMLFPLEGSMMLPRNVMQHIFQLQYVVRRYFFSVFGFESIILLLLVGLAATTKRITAVAFLVSIVILWRAGRHGVLTDIVAPFRCHVLCVLLLLAYALLNIGVPPGFVNAPPMAGSRACDENGKVNWWRYLGCNDIVNNDVPLTTDEFFLFFATVVLRLAYLGADSRRPLIDRRVAGFRTLGEFFAEREEEISDLRAGLRDDAEAVLPPLPHDVLMKPRTLPESIVSVYTGLFPTAILAFFHGALQTSIVSISETLLGLCLIVYATDIYWTFYRYWGRVTGLLLAIVAVQLLGNLPPVFAWAQEQENVAFSIGVLPWSFDRVSTFSIVLQIALTWSTFVQDRIFNEFFFAWKLSSLHKGSILAFKRHQQLMVHMQDQSRVQEMQAATKEASLVEKLEHIRATRFGKKAAALLDASGVGSVGADLMQQTQRIKKTKSRNNFGLGSSSDDDDDDGHQLHQQQQQQGEETQSGGGLQRSFSGKKTVSFQPTQAAAADALVSSVEEEGGVGGGGGTNLVKQKQQQEEQQHSSAPEDGPPPEVTFSERWQSIRATIETKATDFVLTAIDTLAEHSYTGRRPGLHYNLATRFFMSLYKFIVRRTGDLCVLAFAINFAESGSIADMLLCCSGLTHALVVLPWCSEAYWEGALIYVVFSILVKSAIKICAENVRMTLGAQKAISVLFLDLGVSCGTDPTCPSVEAAAFIDIVFDFFVFGCILVHRRLCVQNGVYVAGGEKQTSAEAEEQLQKELDQEKQRLIEEGGSGGGSGAPGPRARRGSDSDDDVVTITKPVPLGGKLKLDDSDEDESEKGKKKKKKRGGGVSDSDDEDEEEEDDEEPKSMADLAAMRESDVDDDGEEEEEGGRRREGSTGEDGNEHHSKNKQHHQHGATARCLKSSRRWAARTKKRLIHFVDDLQGNIAKRSGSGRDFYTLYLTIDFLVLIYVTFGYYGLIGTVRGSFLEGLQQNLLPGPLVVTMLGLVFSMIADRIIYVTNSMRAKFLFHCFQVIIIHSLYCGWKMWFQTPYIGSGATLFFIKVLYLYVCCAQIRFGFAAHRRHDPFTEQATIMYWLGHVIYRAVPFLFELRVLLDWSFARTALRLKAWWLIEDVHYWIYNRFTDIDDDRVTNPKRGSSFPVFVRIAHGISLFSLIVFILFFPLMYYSTFNPNLVPNRVVTMTARMSLSSMTEIYDATELGYLDETVQMQSFKILLGETRPSLLPYIQDDSRTTQVVDLSSCSSNLWSVSPYTRRQLLDRMDRGISKLRELRRKGIVDNAVQMLEEEDAGAAGAGRNNRTSLSSSSRSGSSSSAGAGGKQTGGGAGGSNNRTVAAGENTETADYLVRQATELESIAKRSGVFFVDMNMRVVRSGSTGALSNDVTMQRRVALPASSLKRLYNIVSRTKRYPDNETALPPVAEQLILQNKEISHGVELDQDRTIWVPAVLDPFLLNRPTGVALFSESGRVKVRKNLLGCLLMNYKFDERSAPGGQASAVTAAPQTPSGDVTTNSSTPAPDSNDTTTALATTPAPAKNNLADLLSQESWCLRCEALFKNDTIQPDLSDPDSSSSYMCEESESTNTLASSLLSSISGGGGRDSKNATQLAKCNFERTPAATSSYPGMYFVAISEPIPSEGGFLPNVGIIALYTTFILTLFTLLRRKFTLSSQRVVLEEVADPRPVAELVSYIYLTRSVGGENDLVLEELLYFELLDLIRSPESILKLTGRRVQDYNSSNEYTRSIEVNF